VEKAWNSSNAGSGNIGRYQQKIRRVKDILKGWGSNIKEYRNKDKINFINELENLEGKNILSGDQYARKRMIQSQLMQIYEEEENFWRERESENVSLHGDNNLA
jgi:hypothetical protein